MKRTPLRRKTPLRAKGPPDRAGRPLRRSRLNAKPRPADDRVTPQEAAYVFARDGNECIIAKFERLGLLDGAHHTCLNQWGDPLGPGDQLSIEHVTEAPTMGDRAPSNRSHMVAACPGANWLTYEASKYRWLVREYLRQVEPST